MTPDQLRAAIAVLEERIRCDPAAGSVSVTFDQPTAGELASLGIGEGDAARLLGAEWWPEMAAEIVDTPSFCAPDEPPDTVLRYARDVVGEYVRKRFTP